MNKRNIFLGIAVLFVIAQFFQIDKTNPAINQEKTFVALTNPDAETLQILKTACYDCHSNATEYPWYTSVAPLSWWIDGHIQHGREHLNFSNWGDYNAKKQAHKLEEIIEVTERKEMPMLSYWIVHWDAKMSDAQRKKIIDFTASLQ